MTTLAQDLFAQAHDLPSAEREAFLAKACGDNAELRLEVERLLVDAERAQSFFSDDDGATIGAEEFGETYTEKEGDQIGPYKLRQQIGEGGFGTVWMAEQSEPISRMVALKVIKAGMDTKQVLARFEAERQAVAMMDHPNIAKVLDAGATATGRPYFAMELVKGIPITDYCDEAGLGTTERLALFGDVCSAINHAHQKGIIHRDIKPSNVMVTLHGDKPVVKVIDFGIAKATQGKLTDQTLFTKFEQMIGTPVYMSPEQASLSGLDIDTRSDIYALGILLYELLVGKPPFEAKSLVSAGYEEMRRIIREVEPMKPSSRLSTVLGEERTALAKSHRIDEAKLDRLVEPDLDWIVMKAIDKDRSRRYETANAFAQDIVNFLADEAVTARPPSAGYQFRKFAKRNKAAFRVAAMIALLLVAATAVSSWQAVRATQAEKKTAETLAEVAAERDAKEKALTEAEAVTTFLTETFQSADPARDGRTITVAETLDTAAKKLDTELTDQPERRAKLQATLGATYHALGLYPKAIPLKEKVRDYHLATSGPEHPATFAAMGNLANSYADAGLRDKVLKMQEEMLAVSRKVNGPEHPHTLGTMINLAGSYHAAGRQDDALEMSEEVLPLARKVNGPGAPSTLAAMTGLASSYDAVGREDEALALREEVLPLFRKVHGPEHPETLIAMSGLASSYHKAGRHDEALEMREQVLALFRNVSGPEHSNTLLAMGNLAGSYHNVGRRDEALDLREEVLALFRKVHGPEHPHTLKAMTLLARSFYDAGRQDDALKMTEEVLELYRKELGSEHPDTLKAMNNLAVIYNQTGRRGESLTLGEELLELRRKVLGSEHPDTLRAMSNLVVIYNQAGRRGESLKMQEEMLELHRMEFGPEHPDTLGATNKYTMSSQSVASEMLWDGKISEYHALTRKLLELIATSEKVEPLRRVAKIASLAPHPDAKVRKAVLAQAQKARDLDEKRSVWTPMVLGMALFRNGEHAVAAQVLKNDSVGGHIGGISAYYRAMSLFQQERQDDARSLFTAAEAVMKPLPVAGEDITQMSSDNLILWLAYKEAGTLLSLPLQKIPKPVKEVLIPPTSEWTWLHSTDGTDPAEGDPDFHQTFFTTGFDDATWETGKDSAEAGGGYGYGDEWFKGVDIGTPSSKELGKSSYFRHRFTTTEEHTKLELRCQRDDGIIIYLDGKEVARENMTEGKEAYRLPAATAVSGGDETTTCRIPLGDLTLPPGEHVLAISVHNTQAPSSDLRIGGITLVEVEPQEAK